MSFGDSFKKLVGIEEIDDDITDEEVQAAKEKIARQAPAPAPSKPAPQEPVARPAAPAPEKHVQSVRHNERRFTVTSTNAFKLVLIEPKTFDEGPKLVDSLKSKKPVIINLERLETEIARKIFDFLSGATYALDGNVQKVANNIFIFAPANVDITGGKQNESPAAFDYAADDKASKSDSPWR